MQPQTENTIIPTKVFSNFCYRRASGPLILSDSNVIIFVLSSPRLLELPVCVTLKGTLVADQSLQERPQEAGGHVAPAWDDTRRAGPEPLQARRGAGMSGTWENCYFFLNSVSPFMKGGLLSPCRQGAHIS